MAILFKSVVIILLVSLSAYPQTKNYIMHIKNTNKEFTRSKTIKKIYSFSIESEGVSDSVFKDYSVSIKPNLEKSSLPQTEFEFDFKESILFELKKSYNFYLILLPNAEIDKERLIQLDLTIQSKKDPKIGGIVNDSTIAPLMIKIQPIEPDTALNNYNYLAYIGTNFDLVDGIKAKNLFFATNLYKLPKVNDLDAKNDIGFNLTLYGNRTQVLSEDHGFQTYDYKYVKFANKDSARVYKNYGKLTESKVSDNLGAAFSPMINFFNLGNPKRTVQILYAPQIEFIWRRYTETLTYSDITPADSSRITPWRGSDIFILNPAVQNKSYNYYDVNLGLLSFFLSHENRNISIRFQPYGGYSFRYTNRRLSSPIGGIDTQFEKKENFFFGARLWITEPVTGLTLGAEVGNRLFKNYEPFYNVTLSKALSFKNIGSIFSPVITR